MKTSVLRPLTFSVVICAIILLNCGPAIAQGQGRGVLAAVPALALDSDKVLGFETSADWTVNRGMVSATDIRTQGDAALAIDNPKQLTTLTGAPVASTATALAELATPGATFLVDVFLPVQIGNVHNQGTLQLFVRCKSCSINNAYLGMVRFNDLRLGTYHTVKFDIPATVQQELIAAPFSDLIFEFQMHAPGKVADTYRFDNLRVRAFGTPVPGPGESVDLVAQLFASGENKPGTATFPAGAVQVPQSFHVKLGNAGTGTTRLDLGFDNQPFFATCTYGASADGTSYDLTSCSGGSQAGDLIGANHAMLTIVSAAAEGAKIRAQLALNPVGDLVGTNIIPPMPTWWGECVPLQTPVCEPAGVVTDSDGNVIGQGKTCSVCDASSVSRIVTDYFNQVAQNPPIGLTVKTPVGEFARQSGDGSPHDNLTGPPPPNDPPFDEEGHMSKGSAWDAYWRLQGGLSANVVQNSTRTQLDAELSTHAVLFGKDVEIAKIEAYGFAESGQITNAGFTQQNSGGNLSLMLFGNTVSGGGSIPTGGSFHLSLPLTRQNLDLPPISIWIFKIRIGVSADIGVAFSGNMNPLSLAAAFTPSAGVSGHLEGGIELGIARGGINAYIDLLRVQTPVSAVANTHINTAPPGTPSGCRIGANLNINGELELSCGGGEVTLEAEFGVCPFCYSDSWGLFDWEGATLAKQTLFNSQLSLPAIPLEPASELCEVGLNVSFDSPTPNMTVEYGIPFSLAGHAYRPATLGVGQKDISCGQSDGTSYAGTYMWATDDGYDLFIDPATGDPGSSTGCDPMIMFAKDKNTRNVTLNVIDQYGEFGSAQVNINIVPPPPGPHPFISNVAFFPPGATNDRVKRNPNDDYDVPVYMCADGTTLEFSGGEFNGTLPVEFLWILEDDKDNAEILGGGTRRTKTVENIGTTVYTTIVWNPLEVCSSGNYTLSLYTVDADGYDSYAFATIHITQAVR